MPGRIVVLPRAALPVGPADVQLAPAALAQTQALAAPALTQANALTAQGLAQTQATGAVTLSLDGGEVAVGTLVHDGPATPEQISLWLPVTGTVSQTATATCRYRVTAGSWVTGHPLYRVRPSFSTSPAVGGSVQDGFAWVIIDLQPGTEYEVEVTVTDGANQSVKTLTHTTRSLPATAGSPNKTANSIATIASQLSGLNPGDVLEIADGTYATTGSLSISRSGTSGSPIYLRGASREGTILTASAVRTFFSLANGVSDVVIENMTLQGNGVDQNGDTASSYTTVMGQPTDTAVATRVTLRNVTATGIDRGVYLYNGQGVLVYDNTLTGNNLWQTSPTNFLGSNRTWNDDGLNLAGSGNCGFNNSLTGFGDTLAYAQHVGNDVTHNGTAIHFYRNDIRNSCDDPVEVDHGRRNLTFYDNRGHNTINCDSIDPLYGGPWICARNIIINPYRVNTHKWNDTNTGQFLYSNTYVATKSIGTDADVANWYQPNNGAQRSYGYRNNVHVYRGDGQSIWLESTTHDPIDWTHNAWYPDRGIQWGPSYANLAAAQSGLGNTTPIFSGTNRRMQNDVIVTTAPFDVTVTLGATAATEVTATYTPAIASGNAKNSGVVIPNITDGYSGAAPDMGAVIEGRPSVTYGDRSAIPAYIAAMNDWDVLQMTGTYSPTNGNETLEDVTPSEWLTNDPAANQGLPSVVNAWSGGFKGEGAVLYVHGGGHDDSANNGIYAFDFNGTAKPVGMTLLPNSLSAVADVVQSSTVYDDGYPTSIHTYDACVRVGTDLYRFGGAYHATSSGPSPVCFKFDALANAWDRLPDISGSSLDMTAVHDPVSNKILIMDGNDWDMRFFRCDTDVFGASRTFSSVVPGSDGCAAYDPDTGRVIVNGQSGNIVLTPNWSAETVSQASLTFSGVGDVLGSGRSVFYDPDAQCFWIFGGTGSFSTIYKAVWTSATNLLVTSHSLGATVSAVTQAGGSFGRFVFMRNWRAIGFLGSHAAAPYVIKLPEA